MNIKSISIALGICATTLSAAEPLPSDSNTTSTEVFSLINAIKTYPYEITPDLKDLIHGYLSGTKSVSDINSYVKSLQEELYKLVDGGEVSLASNRFEAVAELLYSLFEKMNEVEQWKAGAETLNLIDQYISEHKNSETTD